MLKQHKTKDIKKRLLSGKQLPFSIRHDRVDYAFAEKLYENALKEEKFRVEYAMHKDWLNRLHSKEDAKKIAAEDGLGNFHLSNYRYANGEVEQLYIRELKCARVYSRYYKNFPSLRKSELFAINSNVDFGVYNLSIEEIESIFEDTLAETLKELLYEKSTNEAKYKLTNKTYENLEKEACAESRLYNKSILIRRKSKLRNDLHKLTNAYNFNNDALVENITNKLSSKKDLYVVEDYYSF